MVLNKSEQSLAQCCEDCKLPLWKTDDGLYMLSIRQHFMQQKDFEQYELLTCSLIFKQYCLTTGDDQILQRYYCNLQIDDVTIIEN